MVYIKLYKINHNEDYFTNIICYGQDIFLIVVIISLFSSETEIFYYVSFYLRNVYVVTSYG